ncbi:hypothetical protein BDZ85DRAFT_267438 [Elsinoe ampelina]|uniref:Uncharacterized protein n=1 Tax=Elsinoe ampelina TaxID=302913 RepID=A0A6A6G3F5_9PEZI|nr:hypothetical protein BDZ85DRAFT_267438 [Elsinoe ampelina]
MRSSQEHIWPHPSLTCVLTLSQTSLGLLDVASVPFPQLSCNLRSTTFTNFTFTYRPTLPWLHSTTRASHGLRWTATSITSHAAFYAMSTALPMAISSSKLSSSMH